MEPLDSKITEKFRKWIVKFDVAFHVIAAILLLVASGYILFHGTLNIMNPSRASIMMMPVQDSWISANWREASCPTATSPHGNPWMP